MGISYSDLNIRIQIENTELLVLNITFGRFYRRMQKHSHGQNSYELHYIPYGYGIVIVDGKTYEVKPNTLYVTGPHIEHEQIPDVSNPMAEYCLYFIFENWGDELGDLLKIIESTPFWFGQDSQNIYSNIFMVFQELENSYTGYMTQIETLLQQLIVKLARNYECNKTSKKRYDPSNLTDRKYIITEKYFLYEYKTLSLEVLADKLGFSVRQTNRFLKDCYGKNFQQKKAEAKMSVASVLLIDKEQTVTEIAIELGYSSLEHFVTAFKRYYGMSTSEYRKNVLYKQADEPLQND